MGTDLTTGVACGVFAGGGSLVTDAGFCAGDALATGAGFCAGGRWVSPDGGGMPRSAKNWAMFSTELYVLPVYRLRFTDSRTSCCSEKRSTSSVCCWLVG